MEFNESSLASVMRKDEGRVLAEWLDALTKQGGSAGVTRAELDDEARALLRLLIDALGRDSDIAGPTWAPVREMLAGLSRSRARQGSTPSETAMFVLAIKEPVFTRLRAEYRDPEKLGAAVWAATVLFDRLALQTTEAFQKSREEIIHRQQKELLELSTPVVTLWDGILAVPLIGTLDSERTQVVMESLLDRIVETGASIAIIDITGVPTVDTLVAQHLLKTVCAARLMGAECIISGIRPQTAQTIVHLGLDLGSVVTKASLSGAFRVALDRLGASIQRPAARA